MKNVFYKKGDRQTATRSSGFSLAEALAALTIGAMILVAVLAIYDRTETATASVISKLDELRLPSEVLQRIAEDLDRLAFGRNTKITVKNKLTNLYQSARLEIIKTYYDKSNKKQTLEKIVWVAVPDPDDDGLILYRSHSGVTGEDKLLDSEKEDWQRQLFVPICNGVTFFKIEIPSGDDFFEAWTNEKLPNGLRVTISFAI